MPVPIPVPLPTPTSLPNDFSGLVRARRSTRDFIDTPIPSALLQQVLDDANWSPSWSNTQPFKIAIAEGAVRDQISAELCANFERGTAALASGLDRKSVV